ncbi:hypothetical protein WDW89_14735 [Deltaproteobacteria bacterium TL4]
MEQHPEVMRHQGQYPVIFLTFKDVKAATWESCLTNIGYLLANECGRLSGMVESLELTDHESGKRRDDRYLSPSR